MHLNKAFLKILCAGLCLFVVTTTANAAGKEKLENSQPAKTNIIEEKTGISVKNNRTLSSLYNEAVEWLKTPYRLGGMSHRGMDCSGLASTIYENVFGIKLQRRSRDISKLDVDDLTKDELKPGDLVFFSTSRRAKGVNHVGVYLGNNHFVHASCSNGVIISNLNEAYYKRTWVKGGRVKDAEDKIFENLFAKQENPSIQDITTSPVFIDNIRPPHNAGSALTSNQILNIF
ncbi:C40 family peptidase [Dysgonomonas sp. OttesenSCG-928-M03]|nr:C40 family peptidase [Dysgonomonas sp. OttesenSCG-928-M03]